MYYNSNFYNVGTHRVSVRLTSTARAWIAAKKRPWQPSAELINKAVFELCRQLQHEEIGTGETWRKIYRYHHGHDRAIADRKAVVIRLRRDCYDYVKQNALSMTSVIETAVREYQPLKP